VYWGPLLVMSYLQQERDVGGHHDEGGVQGGLEVVDHEGMATQQAGKQAGRGVGAEGSSQSTAVKQELLSGGADR